MSTAISSRVRGIVSLIAEAIWPSRCVVCGSEERLVHGEVCETCLGSLLPGEARKTPKELGRLEIAFAYEEVLRQIVHRFKFEHAVSLAMPLAERLADRLEQMRFRVGNAVLLPVPDHPTRRRERGYNPSGELARGLGRLWQRPVRSDIVQRVHYGPHQSILSDNERRKMHVNTFVAKPPVPGEETTPLLLIDDVIHTSTTLRRCASSLRRAGWQQVDAAVLSG